MINGNGNGGDGCEGVGDDHDGDYPGIVLSIVLRFAVLARAPAALLAFIDFTSATAIAMVLALRNFWLSSLISDVGLSSACIPYLWTPWAFSGWRHCPCGRKSISCMLNFKPGTCTKHARHDSIRC